MPALVAGIHAAALQFKGVDGRDKPGHDNRVEPILPGRRTSAPLRLTAVDVDRFLLVETGG